MTQFPTLDRILYKSVVSDILKNAVAVPILKIVSENLDERQEKGEASLKSESETETKSEKEAKNGDFLARFVQIQETNPGIPSWCVCFHRSRYLT